MLGKEVGLGRRSRRRGSWPEKQVHPIFVNVARSLTGDLAVGVESEGPMRFHRWAQDRTGGKGTQCVEADLG